MASATRFRANRKNLQSASRCWRQGYSLGPGEFDGPQYQLHNRVAWHEGALWYDLSDREWSAVRVAREGWTLETNPPVLFRRFAHQRPQVEPKPGGKIDTVLSFFNLLISATRR